MYQKIGPKIQDRPLKNFTQKTEIFKFCLNNKILYSETSSKNDINIKSAFNLLIEEIYKKNILNGFECKSQLSLDPNKRLSIRKSGIIRNHTSIGLSRNMFRRNGTSREGDFDGIEIVDLNGVDEAQNSSCFC